MELYDKGGTGIHETVFAFLKDHFTSCDFTSHEVFASMRKHGFKFNEDQVRRALYDMNRLRNTDLLKLRRAQYRLRKKLTNTK